MHVFILLRSMKVYVYLEKQLTSKFVHYKLEFKIQEPIGPKPPQQEQPGAIPSMDPGRGLEP